MRVIYLFDKKEKVFILEFYLCVYFFFEYNVFLM